MPNPLTPAPSSRDDHLHPETKPEHPWGPTPGSPSGFPTLQGPYQWDIPENIQMPAPMLGYYSQLGATPSSVPIFLHFSLFYFLWKCNGDVIENLSVLAEDSQRAGGCASTPAEQLAWPSTQRGDAHLKQCGGKSTCKGNRRVRAGQEWVQGGNWQGLALTGGQDQIWQGDNILTL